MDKFNGEKPLQEIRLRRQMSLGETINSHR